MRYKTFITIIVAEFLALVSLGIFWLGRVGVMNAYFEWLSMPIGYGSSSALLALAILVLRWVWFPSSKARWRVTDQGIERVVHYGLELHIEHQSFRKGREGLFLPVRFYLTNMQHERRMRIRAIGAELQWGKHQAVACLFTEAAGQAVSTLAGTILEPLADSETFEGNIVVPTNHVPIIEFWLHGKSQRSQVGIEFLVERVAEEPRIARLGLCVPVSLDSANQ